MVRIFAACPYYVQGPDAVEHLVETVRRHGDRAAIVIDEYVRTILSDKILAGFGNADAVISFSGEITAAAVDRLAEQARTADCNVAVAVGGGKALDAGKGVAKRLGVSAITVPTLASTDSPASQGIAIYDDDHRLVTVEQLDTHPAAVVVDTSILAAAPRRYLLAGIGDALAKKFEGEATLASNGRNKYGTKALQAGLIAAQGCYDVLRRHGVRAVQAAGTGVPTDDFEAVVEACFLLSALGFENTGISLAHSLTRGLVKARGVKDAPHGYQIGYGLLVQLAIEGRDRAELTDVRGFLVDVGLPTTLEELGMPEPTADEIQQIAALTMTSPHIHNVARPVTPESFIAAIRLVEGLAA